MKGHLDSRFSEATEPTPWAAVDETLRRAELYWLTTVRTDRRPHVTPLVGVWVDDAFLFCTGPAEQKARNLAAGAAVAVTTGANRWNDGLDVVVEGNAEPVTGRASLKTLADSYRAKYGADWDFDCDDSGFGVGDDHADVYQVRVTKVIAFSKSPHAQTTFTFSN